MCICWILGLQTAIGKYVAEYDASGDRDEATAHTWQQISRLPARAPAIAICN